MLRHAQTCSDLRHSRVAGGCAGFAYPSRLFLGSSHMPRPYLAPRLPGSHSATVPHTGSHSATHSPHINSEAMHPTGEIGILLAELCHRFGLYVRATQERLAAQTWRDIGVGPRLGAH